LPETRHQNTLTCVVFTEAAGVEVSTLLQTLDGIQFFAASPFSDQKNCGKIVWAKCLHDPKPSKLPLDAIVGWR
jgi:hypothetical protein